MYLPLHELKETLLAVLPSVPAGITMELELLTHPDAPGINQTVCHVRALRYSLPVLPCDRCGQPAARFSTVARTAIDLDLDQPTLLLVTVSVHHCRPCHHYFRAQPPFLRADATYTNRVVTKALQAVYQDGMAFRRTTARLARDFWVCPSEGSIRRWCRSYGTSLDLSGDYQPWVVEAFSGVLCIDEIYQGDLALLVAVDPAAPDGDRMVGYQLVSGSVKQTDLAPFLTRLQAAGIQPDQIITDGSSLYPTLLKQLWPSAVHQLCLFHETRRVTAAVQQVYREVRSTIPKPPPAWTHAPQARAEDRPRPPEFRGRPRTLIPAADATDLDAQARRARHALRLAGIAQVHALRHSGLSVRGIARQTGLARQTIDAWLREPVPCLDAGADEQPSTASSTGSEVAVSPQSSTPAAPALLTITMPPPPAPWTSWEEVRQTREQVTASQWLLLRRPDHLSAQEQAQLEGVFARPVGGQLQIARTFLEDWYSLWRDEHGQRRSLAAAQARYQDWQANPAYQAVASLHKILAAVDESRFVQLSQFLKDPTWEATNNGAERAGRAFRHLQGSHFNLRTRTAIDHALAAQAHMRKDMSLAQTTVPPSRCTRGRKPGRVHHPAVA